MNTRIGILTVSDRASTGEYEDRSGPAIQDVLAEGLQTGWEPVARLVSDDRMAIEQALMGMADDDRCCLVVTTGGTGPVPRDVTPEATTAVCEKLMPGFGEEMRRVSQKTVPTAILSRQVAGIRGTTLILNLPGKPAAIAECLEVVLPAAIHCVKLMGGPALKLRGSSGDACGP